MCGGVRVQLHAIHWQASACTCCSFKKNFYKRICTLHHSSYIIWLDRKHCIWNCAEATFEPIHYHLFLHRKCYETSFICCFTLTAESLIWPVFFFLIFLFMVTGRWIIFICSAVKYTLINCYVLITVIFRENAKICKGKEKQAKFLSWDHCNHQGYCKCPWSPPPPPPPWNHENYSRKGPNGYSRMPPSSLI